jgi:hypothetical protein
MGSMRMCIKPIKVKREIGIDSTVNKFLSPSAISSSATGFTGLIIICFILIVLLFFIALRLDEIQED